MADLMISSEALTCRRVVKDIFVIREWPNFIILVKCEMARIFIRSRGL